LFKKPGLIQAWSLIYRGLLPAVGWLKMQGCHFVGRSGMDCRESKRIREYVLYFLLFFHVQLVVAGLAVGKSPQFSTQPPTANS
jgi:hypothetical protein